ncbi:MAG: family 10 glycosylhydrolase [Eubacteriales bacterium]
MLQIKSMPRRRIILAASAVLFIIAAVLTSILLLINPYESEMFGIMNTANFTASSGPVDKIRNPESEMRGVWIATVLNIDYPAKAGADAAALRAELDDIVRTTAECGLNAIFFQVRPASDALYASEIFPASAFLSGKQGVAADENFDALAYITELAHKNNIALYAWVNPLRVTTGSANAPQTDVTALAENNPARKNPDWVISYADGRLYYDCGRGEVRSLVAAGVAEIVRGYDVDGVVFDDYFYPYPVSGATFDDAASYKKYGGGLSQDDWRRQNVNKLVRECYDAIKAEDENCAFGIAPFGIWQNDNGTNGGSDTSGLSSYSAIYCDPLAWADEGSVDFIAPQIYWQFSTSVARYDVLCRWWNAALDGKKSLSGEDIKFYICHAAYRSSEWESESEIAEQVEYARSERCYAGSVMYGYAAIKANEMELRAQLASVYSQDIVYAGLGIASNGKALVISSPRDGSYLNYASTYIIGSSDPTVPLTFGGKAVSRTKDGYFSLYVELNKTKNVFTFVYGGEETQYVINKGYAPSEKRYAKLDSYEITSVTPTCGYIVDGGTALKLSATAPSGSTVTASLGGTSVTLEPTINPPSEGDYMSETYIGVMTLPDSASENEIKALGKIQFTAVRGNESDSAEGSDVRIKGEGDPSFAVEVKNDVSDLKIAVDSWYYDDYTSQAAGMRDNCVALADGYYRLRMGGYIAEKNITEIGGWIANAKVSGAEVKSENGYTRLYVKCSQNVPLNGYIEDGKFVLTMYNLKSSALPDITLGKNPMFTAASSGAGSKAGSARYYLTLKALENFYGFDFSYDAGYIIVTFKEPEKLTDSAAPLSGKTIVLDAGHGGSESGAPSPDPTYYEKDLNLDITLAAKKKLEALGATVVLTRSDDSTVSVMSRVNFLIANQPDLSISIHQNSMSYPSDITRIRGTVALYYADAGYLLTKSISWTISSSLNRLERAPTNQRLALVRNPRYPSTLVEVGFITCVEEFDLMRRSSQAVDNAAQGVADGVLAFYNSQAKYVV